MPVIHKVKDVMSNCNKKSLISFIAVNLRHSRSTSARCWHVGLQDKFNNYVYLRSPFLIRLVTHFLGTC